MWHRTRRKLIAFTITWFVVGTSACIVVWKLYPNSNRTLLVALIAATLFGTILPLLVLFDDWRLHRH
jgi:hypothetical protein